MPSPRMGVTRPSIVAARSWRALILSAALLICTPRDGGAQPNPRPQINGSFQNAPSVDAVEAIALARRLASLGERTRSAMALAAAAQIILDNPTSPLLTTDSAASGVPRADTPRALDATALIAEARALAGSDPVLAQLLSRLASQARTVSRGTRTGPRQLYQQIVGNSRLTYAVRFIAQTPAIVYVSGDGESNLELAVYDDRGHLLASDVTRSGDCFVKWKPERSGTYRIEVRNRRDSPDWYLLVTN
jgi:hypothetical protein